MPASARAGVTAELKVSPEECLESIRKAAGETGLAHEAGPDAINLAGERTEVLDALGEVVGVALDSGAKSLEIKVEAEGDAERF